MIYAYPRLSKADFWYFRIGGNGLGNLLFCWARCLVSARRQGWRMVWPTWFSYKPKNWRVNPYDVRTYGNLFRRTSEYQGGLCKFPQLAFRKWVSESEAELAPPPPGSVVVFRGMAGKFAPFLGERETVTKALLDMTRPHHLSGYVEHDPAPIGIHVRLGDFVRQSDLDTTVRVDNSVLPLDWYKKALLAVRRELGAGAPARVFSDGTDEELRPLLSMDNVKRVTFGSSIADMLALARSRILIASGSTFSMWPSYLGQVPTVWHPGKLLQPVHLGREGREVEWSVGEPMPNWIREV
jgi:hypothetical protein